jgi:hypothetical protein
VFFAPGFQFFWSKPINGATAFSNAILYVANHPLVFTGGQLYRLRRADSTEELNQVPAEGPVSTRRDISAQAPPTFETPWGQKETGGKAQKGGKSVNVSLDFKGNVVVRRGTNKDNDNGNYLTSV